MMSFNLCKSPTWHFYPTFHPLPDINVSNVEPCKFRSTSRCTAITMAPFEYKYMIFYLNLRAIVKVIECNFRNYTADDKFQNLQIIPHIFVTYLTVSEI